MYQSTHVITNSLNENMSGFCAFCTTQSWRLSGIRFSLFIVSFSVFYLSVTKQKFLDIEKRNRNSWRIHTSTVTPPPPKSSIQDMPFFRFPDVLRHILSALLDPITQIKKPISEQRKVIAIADHLPAFISRVDCYLSSSASCEHQTFGVLLASPLRLLTSDPRTKPLYFHTHYTPLLPRAISG